MFYTNFLLGPRLNLIKNKVLAAKKGKTVLLLGFWINLAEERPFMIPIQEVQLCLLGCFLTCTDHSSIIDLPFIPILNFAFHIDQDEQNPRSKTVTGCSN